MIDIIVEKLENLNSSVSSFNKKEITFKFNKINSVVDFILQFVDLNPIKTKIIETTSYYSIKVLKDRKFNNLVNLRWLNDVHCLEKFMEQVNKILPIGGTFICRAETEKQRYIRLFEKFPKFLFFIYYSFDFLLFRFLPKWGLTKYFYYFFTRHNNKVLSLAHLLGFFVFYGFEVKHVKDIDNIAHFVLEKIDNPSKNAKPSTGFILKMKRIGKNGKIINIYKLRTMHPYSEYIQDFVYNLNGSGNGDKILDDFRVATWGKYLRKYWIDELPMFFNLLKGDLKLIGVRPLSEAKFSLYPPDLQLLRTSTKPGLIPPFYADLPETFEQLLESERNYIITYKRNPIKTDIKYFLKCCYNIFLKRARSE